MLKSNLTSKWCKRKQLASRDEITTSYPDDAATIRD